MVQWSQITSQEMADDAVRGYADRRIATKDYAYMCLHEGDMRPADADTVGECFGVDTAGRQWWTPSLHRSEFDGLEQDQVGVSDTDGGGTATEAPVNVDVPHVSQTGDALECTMGNWEHEPTAYSYEWSVGGMVVEGVNDPTHYITAPDEGRMASCVVTATNAAGSTVAPRSNEVVIVAPGR